MRFGLLCTASVGSSEAIRDYVELNVEAEPHPPIWVAAASEASVRRAADRGHNLILDQYASLDRQPRRWY